MRINSSETVPTTGHTVSDKKVRGFLLPESRVKRDFVPIKSDDVQQRIRTVLSEDVKGESLPGVTRGVEKKFMKIPKSPVARLTKDKGVIDDTDALETQKKKLRQAAEGFEAIFARQILKNMRSTLSDGGLFGKGTTGEIYSDIMDNAVAETMAKRSELGLADALYKQLVKTVEQEYKSSGDEKNSDGIKEKGIR